MSSTNSLNNSFSKKSARQNEETECLLQTFNDVKQEFVARDEKKTCQKQLQQLRKHDKEKGLKEKSEKEDSVGAVEDFVVVLVESMPNAENYKSLESEETTKDLEGVSVSLRGESRLENDAAIFKGFATLAEQEESECEDEFGSITRSPDKLILHENFDSEACEKCLKILEGNGAELTKVCCSEKMCTLEELAHEEADMFDEIATLKENEKSCKLANIDLDSSGSFRASTHSLSTCHDSLPSARRCLSKKDLYLDLDECRICHDAEGQDLISPCHCAGTSKWVHESCIIRWIRHTKTKQCEICTCPITVKRKKKPIDQWTRPSATCGPCNKLDMWYCVVLALCILIIVGFVVLQSHYDVTDQMETTVIFASIYVLCGMIIMMKARYFWTWFVHRSSFWGNWKNLNEEWKIVEANEANLQSPVSPV